ncbi:MAG TPA: sialidase family protein, partial [Nitrospira sp.]|nr:sialidase family protein [Nitrospira sp.]
TFDGSCEGYAVKESTGSVMRQMWGTSTIMMLPNLSKRVIRMNDDFLAMAARYGFPETKWNASAVTDYSPAINPDPIDSEVIEELLTPYLSELVDSVDNDESPAEEHFTLTTFAPCGAAAHKWEGNATDSYIYDIATGLNECEAFPTNGVAALSHDDGVGSPESFYIRYVNSIGHPHWWFPLWNPEDESEEGQEQWPVDGAPVPEAYWRHTRDQWNYQSALPLIKKTKIRSSVVLEPLEDSEFSLYWATLYNTGASILGIDNFKVIDLEEEESLPTGDDDWSTVDCSITHGANMTVNPSASTCIIKWQIGKFGNEPNMFPYLCDRIEFDWTDTNIVSVTWKLVNAYGEEEVLATTKGVHSWPNLTDGYYIGDWAQDFSAGFDVVDSGADSQVNGKSALAMVDEEQVHFYQLLNGRTATELWAEIEVANAAVDVTIEYPTFHLPEEAGTWVYENGYHQVLIFPNGPGIRFGNWTWYQPAGLQDPPVINQIGVPSWGKKSTGIDVLCWKRVVCQGKERSDGLNTEIAAIWDTVEGQTRAEVDDTTLGAIVPVPGSVVGRGIIWKNFGIGPLCCFPEKERTLASGWEPTGDHCQHSYSLCRKFHRFVSAQKEINLFVGGVQWTEPSTLAVEGWKITEHAHAVENDESAQIMCAGVELAVLRPWRGHFCVTGQLDTASLISPTSLHLQDGRYVRAGIDPDTGDVKVYSADFSSPLPMWGRIAYATDTGDCSYPSLVETPYGSLIVHYDRDDGHSYLRRSDDDGATWNDEEASITNVRYSRIAKSIAGVILKAGFRYNSGSSGPGKVYGQYRNPGDTAYSTLTVFKDDGGSDLVFEDDVFDLSGAPDSADRWLLVARKSGDTDVTEFWSTDEGLTWTEV